MLDAARGGVDVGSEAWFEQSLEWLPGQDSNLQPCGYERPILSDGLGLSHHP